MEKNRYLDLVRKHTPKEDRLKNGTIAFLIGGLMGLLAEVLIEIYSYILDIPTKEASIFVIITLIFFAC